MLIETGHVTPGLKRRLFAFARFNRTLDALEIAQCLFASDELIASTTSA